MTPSIYEFQDFRSYLKIAVPEVFNKNPSAFSWSNFARRLGYASHRTIAMVMRNERSPSADMIQRIASYLKLSQQQTQYLTLLVLLEKYPSKSEHWQQTQKRLEELRVNRPTQLVKESEWQVIHKWYFFAIRQLFTLETFRNSPKWISKILREKVSIIDVRRALETMRNFDIIHLDPKTKRWQALKTDLYTQSDIPCKALQVHHSGMIDLAKQALSEQDVCNRDFTGLTLAFTSDQLSAAKEDIRDFVITFNRKFSSKKPDSVYQLNIQFFEHTTRDSASQINPINTFPKG